jgi:carbamoyl-phosphate synthase large subunit
MTDRIRVLIAGIGGASLGTEVLKCLLLADRYAAFGCDISPLAFGHYDGGFARTFVVDRDDYVASILRVCQTEEIRFIIPGGEEPLDLLSRSQPLLAKQGIALAANTPEIMRTFTDKETTFATLAKLGFRVPKTVCVDSPACVSAIPCPCVVKPASGTGGSANVFLAADHDEASLYVSYLLRNGKKALLQEYIPEREGEFTVGVLSLPGGRVFGSIALKRTFHNKLSVHSRTATGLISSGSSQGLIDHFPSVQATAEAIARKAGSEGPFNVQGRVRDGEFIPFEINPRFSASTYLRALAGFNEIDLYLRCLLGEEAIPAPVIRPGYYLRSFSEVYVSPNKVVA